MSNEKRAKQAYDMSLRVEAMVDMAVEVASTYELVKLTESMEYLAGELYDRKLHPSIQTVYDRMMANGTDDDDIMDAMADWGRDLLGICLQVSTPKQGSPGIRYTKWVYGETYEKAYQVAFEWASELEKKED